MNYEYFSRLEDGSLQPAERESEQAFMERVLTQVFAEISTCNAQILTRRIIKVTSPINDMLSPQFHSCDAQSKTMTITFKAQDWMLNPNGTLHGGLLGTCVDMAVSCIARYMAKKRTVVTVQLSVNFLRVVRKGETFTVSVTADHVGRRSVVTHATVTAESSTKPAATATAVLM